jgi:hypothetical protein
MIFYDEFNKIKLSMEIEQFLDVDLIFNLIDKAGSGYIDQLNLK